MHSSDSCFNSAASSDSTGAASASASATAPDPADSLAQCAETRVHAIDAGLTADHARLMAGHLKDFLDHAIAADNERNRDYALAAANAAVLKITAAVARADSAADSAAASFARASCHFAGRTYPPALQLPLAHAESESASAAASALRTKADLGAAAELLGEIVDAAEGAATAATEGAKEEAET